MQINQKYGTKSIAAKCERVKEYNIYCIVLNRTFRIFDIRAHLLVTQSVLDVRRHF